MAQGPTASIEANRCCTDGKMINPLGVISVQVKVNSQQQQLESLVVPGNGLFLLGCDLLSSLRLDWAEIHHMNHLDSLQAVLDQHLTVFEQSLGLVHGATAKIHVDNGVQPKFSKPGQYLTIFVKRWIRNLTTWLRKGSSSLLHILIGQLQLSQWSNVMDQYACVVIIK